MEGNLSDNVRPCPESLESVVSNDDLLIEILLRLPVVSLVLFKSVSKHWFSLIESPDFTTRITRKLDPPCGLLLDCYSNLLSNYYFLRLDKCIPTATSFTFGNRHILQSCNGLLLCFSSTHNELYVCNPSICKMFKLIPQQPNVTFFNSCNVGGMRMAFDPTKSPHYKIIHVEQALTIGGYFLPDIHTYSSETGVWSVFGDCCDVESFTCFSDGVYWNDAIHWVNNVFERNLHFKLDISNERPILTTLKPPLTLDGTGFHECKMFASCGCLLFVGMDDNDSMDDIDSIDDIHSMHDIHSRKLYIYEMRNRCSEWSVKYIVNLDDITTPLPFWSIISKVCYIVLGEREDDSFIVMKLSNKVVQYKLVSKALCTLSDLESVDGCFEFIASLAIV